MKHMSSDNHDSILRDAYMVEALKHFDWERVRMELKKLPILLTLLKQIVPWPAEQKPLLCLVVSQLLKSRHQRLGLVQRAVSIMLYGNSSSKQVRKLAVCKWAFTDALHYIPITGVHESATSPSVHVLQAHLESCWKDKWAPWCGSTILERWNEKENAQTSSKFKISMLCVCSSWHTLI